ncbi:hypothetical protein AM1_G0116 (plasmid) [Acaryochloris marina MBIC11017]|uniref:Uncharacterized protein n=1 Tax=Acaryochloris marina (strain MBIC 11017) TaxID=329726 RepID=A8ZQL0_ACAM1|nr:hypothetical protein AM1_G0116 [Acaryochloris marina MBIC11017]
MDNSQTILDLLTQVQEKGTSLCASEFQQESWTEYCDEIDYPKQTDWDRWRQGFIVQLSEGFESLMTPGKSLGQFSKVWIREIGFEGFSQVVCEWGLHL